MRDSNSALLSATHLAQRSAALELEVRHSSFTEQREEISTTKTRTTNSMMPRKFANKHYDNFRATNFFLASSSSSSTTQLQNDSLGPKWREKSLSIRVTLLFQLAFRSAVQGGRF